MSDFEAQCDCELDSPGVLSHLPVEERLEHWTEWALYLKRRIETHYRPAIAELERDYANSVGEAANYWDRLQQAEAEVERLRRLITSPVLRMHDAQQAERGGAE